MSSFSFEIIHTDSSTRARVGKLKTPHGDVLTPCWVPVGTQASVKSLAPSDLKEIGAQIVLANTYHLHLRPGDETIEKLGGLSSFMGWNGVTMTDSGGYQVFSLGTAQKMYNKKKLNKFTQRKDLEETSLEKDRMTRQLIHRIKPAKIDEEGVTFFSQLDGSEHRFTPDSSILMQERIGADLIVAFDDHESPLWEHQETKLSLERSNRWGIQSLDAQKRQDQLMYGVVHGGVYEDLRVDSAKFIDKHFPAIAIGGSYTCKEILYSVLDWCTPHFSVDKPRHLLGIAEIADLFEAVERGMDFFDCVAATRRARHGNIYISPKNGGRKENSFSTQLLRAENKESALPLDPGCLCMVCQSFSRAYIHHLFKSEELLAFRLTSYHNVYFVTQLMEQIREAIGGGSFSKLKESWLKG